MATLTVYAITAIVALIIYYWTQKKKYKLPKGTTKLLPELTQKYWFLLQVEFLFHRTMGLASNGESFRNAAVSTCGNDQMGEKIRGYLHIVFWEI